MKAAARFRWYVVGVFFLFMLLHQSDRLLIGPLTTDIMEDFKISRTQMGAVSTGALLVASLLYPLWGYLYDRYARSRLLALAAFIWGSTTWLSAIAPTYRTFLATRASTGIDDSSYPGLYSLASDYFGPHMRGKVYGLLQVSLPLGYLLGLVLALGLGPVLGWRTIFYITGTLGLVVAGVMFFSLREPPRGRSEPELAGLTKIGTYHFDPRAAVELFRKRSLLFLFAQGFVGVVPWNVITFWFFNYLETERGYGESEILLTMAPAVLVLAGGYFVGGVVGDYLFARRPRGRLLTALVGILTGAILLTLTLNVPVENQGLFFILLLATALFIPFASPNVISTVHDITLPEVRSTAVAVQYFIENGGAALAPLLAGIIADRSSLQNAILSLSVGTWLAGAVLVAFAAYVLPPDLNQLREQLRARAAQEKTTLDRAAPEGAGP
jgi:MFS family permease